MKLIDPSYEILEQKDGYQRQIERIGRVCYKSEDKMGENTDRDFLLKLILRKHYAMLEHGSVYLETPIATSQTQFFENNPYSRVNYVDGCCYVTTNYRVIVENNVFDILKFYEVDETENHPRRVSVKFICDRGVSHELVRHRVFSFAQESTRFCNYSNETKFEGGVTFIKPCWVVGEAWKNHMKVCEKMYLDLIEAGWSPQQARSVLPNSLKTELVMTGFIDDWKHFFDLRAKGVTGTPHPQTKELAMPLLEEFIRRGWIEEDFASIK